jgi:hypothetical protein
MIFALPLDEKMADSVSSVEQSFIAAIPKE